MAHIALNSVEVSSEFSIRSLRTLGTAVIRSYKTVAQCDPADHTAASGLWLQFERYAEVYLDKFASAICIKSSNPNLILKSLQDQQSPLTLYVHWKEVRSSIDAQASYLTDEGFLVTTPENVFFTDDILRPIPHDNTIASLKTALPIQTRAAKEERKISP